MGEVFCGRLFLSRGGSSVGGRVKEEGEEVELVEKEEVEVEREGT